ncbi:Por secretion system C-terminal sorting domain-containing protein [Dyadobacter soli]|uniref:Por secretion system C-terminal sorting domain-containing protein n=1 Tax=Dyadobacter soli TaxID=659014 RepID=A0A1G7G0F9_9BACT|nr:metallophosphoesterase [Dyadobacter soli]SDE81593.1 Por secretion system C-terminal sorting domain-containing protein [Dyadobacter soli]
MRPILSVLSFCLLLFSESVAQTPKITRGPYLQMAYAKKVNEFATSASVTIRWQTDLPNLGRIVYTPEPEFELLDNGAPMVEEPTATTEHIITLTGLKPDQQYRYYIGAWAPPAFPVILEKTPDHFFKTPPLPGTKKKVKMWVLGDFGYTPPFPATANRQDSVVDSWKDYMTVNKTGPMDLWLWLGDNAYEQGKKDQYQEHIFNKTKARYDFMFRQTPFYATPGNHDYFDGTVDSASLYRVRANKNIHYYEVVNNFTNGEGGGEPSMTEAYYSFDYGNIHFISLDTYGFEKLGDDHTKILAPNGLQSEWLKKDLARANANPDINWVIVFTHIPPFSGGSHNSDTERDLIQIRNNLVPILDAYKVDLVLAGHSHGYERSRLMRDHFTTSTNFVMATHNPALGSNAQSTGRYDGSANSCFYYKNSAATKNEGIIYVVNGAGGRKGEPTFASNVKNPGLVSRIMTASALSSGGSMYIEVENKRLTAKFISAKKQLVDQFTIFKDLDGFTVPDTDDSTRTAVCECTDAQPGAGNFTHYVDGKGKLLLSINKHDLNIGKAGVPPFEVKLGGKWGRTQVGALGPGTNYVRSERPRSFSSNWRVMNRYWAVKPNPELTGKQQVTVRHYYKDSDLSYLQYTDSTYESIWHYSLRFFKINSLSTNYNVDPLSGVHNTIKAAADFNKDGIWLYDVKQTDLAFQQATPLEYKWRFGFNQPEVFFYPLKFYPFYSGEFVVGRLNGGGGIGGQVYNHNPRGTVVLLHAGSVWSFFARGMVPPDNGIFNWKGGQDPDEVNEEDPPNYDHDANWPTGPAPFGYSPNREDGERVFIPACQAELDCYEYRFHNSGLREGCLTTPCATRWTTTYFRRLIRISSQQMAYHKSVIINYKRDDGIVIYINGKELTPRDPNMGNEPVTFNTFASNASPEYAWQTVVVPNDGSFFRLGRNTIAVELHQTSATSSDLYFDMDITLSPDILTVPTRVAMVADAQNPIPERVIYPNPADRDKIVFDTPLVYETLRITDSKGVVRRYISTPGTLKELDISALPAGVFILSNQYKGNMRHYKVIKR